MKMNHLILPELQFYNKANKQSKKTIIHLKGAFMIKQKK